MVNVVTYIFLLIVVGLSRKILVICEPDWTYDVISVDVDNKTPDNVVIELHVVRRSRGIFSVSGFMDFKKDVTDEVFISVNVYYSPTGSYFTKTALSVPKEKFSTVMNSFYKDIVMEDFLNCSENAPRIDETFVSPLSKRVIHVNDCLFSNDNFPSKMRSGYYKVVNNYTNESEGSFEILVKVEPK